MQNLTVVTFNILVQPWIDTVIKRNTIDKRHLQRKYRVAKIIETLKYINADIVLLQEVTPMIINKIKKKLPHYDIPECFTKMLWHPVSPDTPINGNAIMWKKGLFSYAQCSNITLDKKRGNYAAILEAVLCKSTIKVVSLHLEYGDRRAGAAQFDQLFKQKFITSKDQYVIIGGDFNMGNRRWLIDIKRYKLQDCDSTTPTHPFKNDIDDQTIDHILVRGFKLIGSCTPQCKSIGECLKYFGTDHYPVIAKLILRI